MVQPAKSTRHAIIKAAIDPASPKSCSALWPPAQPHIHDTVQVKSPWKVNSPGQFDRAWHSTTTHRPSCLYPNARVLVVGERRQFIVGSPPPRRLSASQSKSFPPPQHSALGCRSETSVSIAMGFVGYMRVEIILAHEASVRRNHERVREVSSLPPLLLRMVPSRGASVPDLDWQCPRAIRGHRVQHRQ